MSSNTLALRLGVSSQGVRKLEMSEADRSITLKTLARLANGLDCEVHYVLVPRTSLMEQVIEQAQKCSSDPSSAGTLAFSATPSSDSLNQISMLLEQINRRGFWTC